LTYTYDNNTWTPQDPNGVATETDNIEVLSGVTTLNQDTDVKNVTVASGATFNIEASLSLTGNLTVNGDMVFISTATNTGQLGRISSSSTVTGEVMVERYIPGRRAFRFVSS